MPRQAPHTVVGGEQKTVSVLDGTTWKTLIAGNDWTIDGGTKEGRSTTSESGAPTGLAGPPSAPIVSVNAYGVPHHAAWDRVEDGFNDDLLLDFRLDTQSRMLRAMTTGTDRAAIAATGVVTFSGNPPSRQQLREGAVLRIADTDYHIRTVTQGSPQVATVDPAPATAVTAANYSIRVPVYRREFQGLVLETPTLHGDLPTGGELNGTLRIQALGELPAWEIQPPA